MQLRIFQKGFNYAQDGPGNRLVYHLKGCNMRCPWCSNPEGLDKDGGEYYIATVEEILQEVLSAKPMFFENGGVTFTGGEATLQAKALERVLAVLKENGIHTAIETNGTYKNLPVLFPYIDHLIIDLKHPDPEKHKQVTGVSNEHTRRNILLAAENGKDLLVRVPLIGGFNTDDEAIAGFLAFFESINRENVRFELLKYHEYGKDKWAKCGLTYTVKDAFVEETKRQEIEAKMRNSGLTIVRT